MVVAGRCGGQPEQLAGHPLDHQKINVGKLVELSSEGGEPPHHQRRHRDDRRRCGVQRVAGRGGCMLVAGVDEAGRGPLAGPVVAAAVVLDPGRRVRGLRDSKLLTPEARQELAVEIRTHAVAWAVAV